MNSVSVVVIAKGDEKGIKACLDSLQSQDVLPREIILVLARESAEWKADGIRVLSDPGGNQAHSRNLGAQYATGPITAFLDSDCIAPPGWVKMIELDNAFGIEAMGGPYIPAQDTDYAKLSHKILSATAGRMSATFATNNGGQRPVKAVSGGDCAFDSTLLWQVGGFDDRQDRREEPELGRKIRERGVPIIFDPNLWVWHRWRGWDGLIPLAKVSYFYGRARIRGPRQLEP